MRGSIHKPLYFIAFFCSAGAALLVAGCAVHGAWYLPQAPVGHAANRQCGTAGRKNAWILKRQQVIMRVAVLPPANDHGEPIVNIDMTVPKERKVKSKFGLLRALGPSNKPLQSYFSGNATGYVNGIPHVYRFGARVKELDGSKFSTQRHPSTIYHFGLTLNHKLPSSLDVVLPGMEINGHEYPPFTIHFTKKTGTYFIVGINC